MNRIRRVCRSPAGRARRTSAQLACSTAVAVVRAAAGSRPTGCNDPAKRICRSARQRYGSAAFRSSLRDNASRSAALDVTPSFGKIW
jgi:hypothetical protein